MSPKSGEVDGCGTGIVVLIIGVTLLALLASGVHAQEPWAKSSIKLDGQCRAVCQRGVVVDFLDAPGGHVVFVVREGKAFADSYFTVRHFRITQRVRVCAGVVS